MSFIKKEPVLSAAAVLAVLSMFFVHPSTEYLSYIDFRTLALLFSLMTVVAGLKRSVSSVISAPACSPD